ncbi:MAG: hypothetical protein K2K47_01415, partial [Duncaniella sp.]|nr:hypothetical protein [Duncaniella sp.]
MKRSLLYLMLWLAALTAINVRAENAYNPSPTGFKDLVTEPSPEVAALNRHIDCPVSYATGSYTLSVPLFSWDECGFPISLSLNYTPGIKADDKSGIFGLGWSLGGITGTISRQVIGLPDDMTKTIVGDNDGTQFLSSLSIDDLHGFSAGNKDSFADKFYYSVNGYSGCFIIRNKKVVDLSYNEVEISYDHRSEIFTINTPEGWIYTFTPDGESSRETNMRAPSNTFVNTNYSATSLWAISEISLPDNVSVLKLSSTSRRYQKKNNYELYSFTLDQDGNSSSSDKGITNQTTTSFSGFCGYNMIKGEQATVTFDCGEKVMTGTVTDSSGKVVREIIFEFDTTYSERKKLIGITICSDGIVLDRREFSYYNDSYYSPRPEACSDYFGYSNRKTPYYYRTGGMADIVDDNDGKKTELGDVYIEPVPDRPSVEPVSESVLTPRGEINPHREYVFDHACSASLKEMADANGLITRITYEPNSAPLMRGIHYLYDVNIGIRVAKIETEDQVNGSVKTRSFNYYNPILSIPLGGLSKSDFVSHSGILPAAAIQGPTQTTTLTSSCRRPGMSAENAVVLYGAVEEAVFGPDMKSHVKTRYEFDNEMSVCSTFSITPRTNHETRNSIQKNNPYLGYGIQSSLSIVGNNDVRSGFKERFYQKSPLVKKIVYECDSTGDYHIKEETINKYHNQNLGKVATGIFCDRLKRLGFDGRDHYIDGLNDFNIGIAYVERGRTYLDSTIVIKYFPDGSSRRIETRYVYPDRDLASVRNVFPDEGSDIHEGSLHRPVGTIVKCAGTTIAKYDLLSDHISTHGTGNSMIHTLPVLSRTIVNNKEFTSSVYYSYFNTNPKLYLLPSRYETVGKDGEPIIDWLAVDGYNSRRQPLKVRRHASPTMVYTYQADGQALDSIIIDGTKLIKRYTHQPLVGYTSATSPAGNTTYYEYSGSRLSRILDRDHKPVKAYEYHLFSPDDHGHGYIRETTFLDDRGETSMSARQIFDCYGEQYATIAENASAPNVDIVNFTRLDALGRPVRQYLPFTFTGSDEDLSYQELTAYGDSIARSFYSDQVPYTATEYIRGSASTTPAITIDAGSDRADWITTVAEKCNTNTDFHLRCIRLEMSGRNSLRCLGYWPAGSLDVTEVKDADGARVLEFTDFRGQKLLSRRILDGTHLDTYYVYDEWGNLCLALPPEVTVPSVVRTINVTTNASMLDYAYHYVYDEANRLISKKLPGAEKITYSYDADGLPAFTQDGNMRRDGKAMFTLYDAAGRVVVTGTCASSVMNSSESMRMRASYSASQLGIDSTRYVTDVQLPSAQMLSATYYDAVPAYLGVTCTKSDVLTAPAGLVTAQVDRV